MTLGDVCQNHVKPVFRVVSKGRVRVCSDCSMFTLGEIEVFTGLDGRGDLFQSLFKA